MYFPPKIGTPCILVEKLTGEGYITLISGTVVGHSSVTRGDAEVRQIIVRDLRGEDLSAAPNMVSDNDEHGPYDLVAIVKRMLDEERERGLVAPRVDVAAS